MATLKTSNPYGGNDTFRSPPDNIERDRSKASGKSKARYPHKPLGIGTKGSDAPCKTPALAGK
jgi:hypothetical protein